MSSMDALIIRIILGLIILLLGSILVYIVRQDRQLKRPLVLDVENLPQPTLETPEVKETSKSGKNGQKSSKKKR